MTVVRSDCVIKSDRTFEFSVPIEQLWATMNRVESYPSWWSWLHEFSVEGVGLESGSTLHGVIVPPLPYRMRLDVLLYDSVPHRFISALVHGDLEGTAHLDFESIGSATSVHAVWAVEMMQRPMRLAARIGSPVLQWGHDRVVDATVEGFRSHLADECGH
jgi:hypothetical protein